MLLITTTRGRPKAFAALVKWVEAQTYDDYEWLIVSDDWEGYKFPKKAKVIKRDASGDTLPSLCHNWLTALDWIEQQEKHQRFVVLEDDDYYSPSYLHEINKLLDKGELAGFNEDGYFYVLARHLRRVHNIEHASLAATAFTRKVLPFLRECCGKGDVFVDRLLWQGYQGKKALCHNFTGIAYGSPEQPKLDKSGNIANEYARHVGCKTNWHGGEAGLSSVGHTVSGGFDPYGDTVKKWFGEEAAAFYLAFTRDPKQGTPHVMLPLRDERQ